jgi:hypothetical protein
MHVIDARARAHAPHRAIRLRDSQGEKSACITRTTRHSCSHHTQQSMPREGRERWEEGSTIFLSAGRGLAVEEDALADCAQFASWPLSYAASTHECLCSDACSGKPPPCTTILGSGARRMVLFASAQLAKGGTWSTRLKNESSLFTGWLAEPSLFAGWLSAFGVPVQWSPGAARAQLRVRANPPGPLKTSAHGWVTGSALCQITRNTRVYTHSAPRCHEACRCGYQASS